MNPLISIVQCKSYDPALVLESTRKTIDLLGGIRRFVKPGSTVLLKPNLLMAKEPEYGITTHPEVVRAIVKILKEIDCRIRIGDGPSVCAEQSKTVDLVYERTGMQELARQEGVELVKFQKWRWRGKFTLTTCLDECDCFISIPKFKTHQLMVLTGAIKNLYGLVSYTFKKELHRQNIIVDDFASAVVDVYAEAKPALTVVDSIVSMEGNGPAGSGKLRDTGLLLAGVDCLALDVVLASIMGLEALDVPTNREAARRGLGTADIKSIQIAGESLRDHTGRPFVLPAASLLVKIPLPFIEFAKKFIRFYPRVNRKICTGCGACAHACPVKIIAVGDRRRRIDYSKCIACFCCQECCPVSAIRVERSFFAKIYALVSSRFIDKY